MRRFTLLATLVLFSAFTLIAQITTDGLVAYYPFNGDASEVLGLEDGKVVGATLTADRFGNPDRAYYFDGTPMSYINLGTSSILKQRYGTISLWVNVDKISNLGDGFDYNPIILTKNGDTDDFFESYCIYIRRSDLKVRSIFTERDPGINEKVITTDPISLDQWYHIALTWTDDSIKLYIDGNLATKRYKGFEAEYSATDSVMLGNSANSHNDRYFAGTMDDLRFYDRALSPLEIIQMSDGLPAECYTCDESNASWGKNSLKKLMGERNTAIGVGAGENAMGSGGVYLGYGAGQQDTSSNKLYIGNGLSTLVKGDFAVGEFKVNGEIKAKEVTIDVTTWPDYVFAADYQLLPLKDLEKYIKTNGHLPNLKPAGQMVEEGASLGEVNAKLLEKIEELTLYMIDLKKENDDLRIQYQEIEDRLKKLEK